MKKNYLIKLVLPLCLMLMSIATYAQTGSISGKVVDESNLPLPGAAVYITGTQLAAQTDINGNYRLNGVSYGNVSVTARFIGYDLLSKNVTVASATTTVDFKLNPS